MDKAKEFYFEEFGGLSITNDVAINNGPKSPGKAECYNVIVLNAHNKFPVFQFLVC